MDFCATPFFRGNMNTLRLKQPTREPANTNTDTGLPVPRGKTPPTKFLYCTYPRGWDYTEGFGFLPTLKKLTAKPGCNGVSDSGDMTRTIAGIHAKGGTVLDPNDTRLGRFQGYVQFYPTTDGRRWYVDFCQEATILPSGEIIWTNSTDPETGLSSWDSFRAFVRDSGIIPGLIKEVYLAIVQGEERTLEALAGRMAGNPALERKYAELEKKIEGMRAAWESAEEQKQGATNNGAAPVKRRRRRSTLAKQVSE